MNREKYLAIQNNKKSSLNTAGYMCALIVEDLNGNQETINFDLVDTISVKSSSNLTENTMMNGDIVADHIYREPDEVTITGKYGLFGNRNIQFSGPWDKLGNIEEYFERIKNNGYKCSIVTRSLLNNSSTRFKTRENMILTNIDWTHQQTSIEFTFTFTEQKTASLQTQDIPYVEEDEDVPEITDGIVASFTEEVLDWNFVYELIIRMLDEDNMLTDEFKQELAELSNSQTNGLIISVVGVAGSAAVLGVLGAVAAAGASVPVIGWVVAVGAGLAALGYGLYLTITSGQRMHELNQAQEKWGTEQFQYFEGDDERNEEELNRFLNFVGGVADYIKTLDNYISIYKIPTNNQQEMMIYIDDDNYVFSFTKTSTGKKTNNKYSFVTADGEIVDNSGGFSWTLRLSTPQKNITTININTSALTDISKCTEGNYLHITSNKYRVYMMYSKLKEDGSPDESGKSDLTNYFVLVSTINFENFEELLTELIQNGGTIPRDKLEEYSNLS